MRRALRPGAAAVALGAALAALDWAAVHTVPGRLVDGRSLRGALLTDSPAASLLERVLDLISVSALVCAVVGILVIALVRRRRAVGLGAVAVLAAANVSTQLLKSVLLVRPDLGHAPPSPRRQTEVLKRTALVLLGVGALVTLTLLAVPAPAGALVLVCAYVAGVGLTTGAAAGVLHMVLAELCPLELPESPEGHQDGG